jgi:hypothetical protein
MIATPAMDALATVFFRANAVCCDEAAWPCDDLKTKTPPKLSPGGVPVSNGRSD